MPYSWQSYQELSTIKLPLPNLDEMQFAGNGSSYYVIKRTLGTLEEDVEGERKENIQALRENLENELIKLRANDPKPTCVIIDEPSSETENFENEQIQTRGDDEKFTCSLIDEPSSVTEDQSQPNLCAVLNANIQTIKEQVKIISQKTSAEFDRLFNEIEEKCDRSTAVRIWREHLHQAENFLSRSLPDQYESTHGDLGFCQLHENLLLLYQSVLWPDMSTQEADQEDFLNMSNLKNLHWSVLSRIDVRRGILNERCEAWEKHMSSLTVLLKWLDAFESEKKRQLEIRHLSNHNLMATWNRFEVFLDKLGQGQALHDEAKEQATRLVIMLDTQSSALAIGSDVNTASVRLIDLESWLCIWRDHLQRMVQMCDSLERGIEAIRAQLQLLQDDIVHDTELPSDCEEEARILQIYREHLLTVRLLSDDIELQKKTADEITGCFDLTGANRIWDSLNFYDLLRVATENDLNRLIELLKEQQDSRKAFKTGSDWPVRSAVSVETQPAVQQKELLDVEIQRLADEFHESLEDFKETERALWLVSNEYGLDIPCSHHKEEVLEASRTKRRGRIQFNGFITSK